MSDKSTTPRPWRVDHYGNIYEPSGKIVLVDGFGLAGNSGEEANNNTNLILRAVNQYDHVAELIEAAKEAVVATFPGEQRDRLRSALAKMEVQP